MLKIAVVGTPRSGSSHLGRVLSNLGGTQTKPRTLAPVQNFYEFNPEGYSEDVFYSMLGDQIIRQKFGKEYSFLFPPDVSSRTNENDFHYDIDSHTLEIPSDYDRNFQLYTGSDWDVWGLTRMLPGKKWWKIYSRLGISTGGEISDALLRTPEPQNPTKSFMFIKDSRFTFTLDWSASWFDAVIILTREGGSLMSSMTRHYGPRMFTDNSFHGFRWVSNHFNYGVRGMEFSEYLRRYELAFKHIQSLKPSLRLDLEDIRDEAEVAELINGFLENL